MTKNNHGFTLIELIVTLAVVSILLLTGIPVLNQMTTNNRLVTQINNIAGSLSLARSESIKRGESITLCGSTDGATCDTSNWESGWIVFTDADNNAVLSSAETMLKIVEPFSGGSTLRLSQSDSTSIIRYKSDGSLRDLDGDATRTDKGTFTLCDNTTDATERKERAKAININTLGRVSRAEDRGGDGIVEDITGITDTENITCP